MQQLSARTVQQFQTKILSWYEENKRELPWREIPFDPITRQRDPYKILVSEVMAQQTQLSRVIPKYEAWMQRFPTVESLVTAPTRDVLLYWSGLGYNRRALNLQKAAREIGELRRKNHESRNYWPGTFEDLVKLPGIGKYTANAILCFAFDKQVAVIDTNVKKVLLVEFHSCHCEEVYPEGTEGKQSHLLDCRATLAMTDKDVEKLAEQLLPKSRAYDWNQALMDYAASQLKKEKIPIPKQSPFRSSNRYYRGHIMKVLVRQHTVSLSDLWQYFQSANPVARERFEAIISQMEKDGLLTIRGDTIRII